MSKNQSQETSKGQGDGATEGVQGTAGAPVAVSAEEGASHVSSKGTPGLSDCHLKAQTQTFGNPGEGPRSPKSLSSPFAGSVSPGERRGECGPSSEGLIISVAVTKEMLPYYPAKVFFLTVSEAVLIITPV